jgi:UDP-N-acetylglucosamine/UDP-N-acetylgalactosamine diphosphorylase
MDARYHICENPDGHGGVVKALGKSGLLTEMARQGVRHIFVHNVDNCLVKVCDPAFLGHHIDVEADFSCKSLPKRSADETLGTIVEDNGRIRIIEYSDTPQEIAGLKNEQGQLVFSEGSINTYLIRVDFLKRLYQQGHTLPVHFVRKRISALDTCGNFCSPQEANGVKLETKAFDVLQYTEKAVVVRANRGKEFSPLKSEEGPESYPAVLNDLRTLFSGWLERSGVHVCGKEVKKIEISPMFALDLDTFQNRVAAIGQATLAEMIHNQVKEHGWIIL